MLVNYSWLRHSTFHRIFSRAELPVRLNLRWDTALRDFQIQLEPRVSRREAASHHAPRDDGSRPHAGLELFEPTKKDLMISKINSRAACLAELTSNPKSFYNCPDLHGGSGLPGGIPLLDPTGNDVNAAATTDLLNGSMIEHVQ
jgi:hypothetical protein